MVEITQILIAPDKKVPMQNMQRVMALAGKGLDGDRYALGTGAYSKNILKIRHVSLIAAEDIANPAIALAKPFTAEETRRNIVVAGLPAWEEIMGKVLCLCGSVMIQIVADCDPCARPAILSGRLGDQQFDFMKAFPKLRAGVRGQIITTGEIWIGGEVKILT